MGRFRTVMAGIGGMAVVGGTGMIIYQNMFMDRHAIVSFFITPTTPNALPRQGTRLTRLDPKPQMGSTPDWVPTYAGGAFLRRNNSASSKTLAQAQLSLKSWLGRLHLL